jgi:hypothetical protein
LQTPQFFRTHGFNGFIMKFIILFHLTFTPLTKSRSFFNV